MKKIMVLGILLSQLAYAQPNPSASYYLNDEDQKYYKNDVMEGNNQRERIDMNVKEINKLYGEIATLKTQVQELKKEMELLKAAKK